MVGKELLLLVAGVLSDLSMAFAFELPTVL